MSNLIEEKLADLEQLSDPIQFIPTTIKGKFDNLIKINIKINKYVIITNFEILKTSC